MINCKVDQYLRRLCVVMLVIVRNDALRQESGWNVHETTHVGEQVAQKLIDLDGSVRELLRLVLDVRDRDDRHSLGLSLNQLTKTRDVINDRSVACLAVVDAHGDHYLLHVRWDGRRFQDFADVLETASAVCRYSPGAA